jgi:hypothetical protein
MEKPPAPSLRTSDALALGFTRGRIAGPTFVSPLRGVVRPTGSETSPLQRIYDVAELVPEGGAIGGWAAAHLLGAPECDGRGPSGLDEEPVPVVLPPPLLIRPRSGVVRWRSDLTPDDLTVVDGIICTAQVRTAFDLARFSQFREAVVELDVLGRQIAVRPAEVAAYAHRHPRWRGKPQALEVVKLADPRARSAGETRLRLVWVLDAGLPPPEVNPAISDGAGWLLGVVDLLDPENGMVGEYDGAHHRAPRQHALDNAREEALEDAGMVVVRAGADDVSRTGCRRTVLRLQSAYRRATARDSSGDRWTWTPEPGLD